MRTCHCRESPQPVTDRLKDNRHSRVDLGPEPLAPVVMIDADEPERLRINDAL